MPSRSASGPRVFGRRTDLFGWLHAPEADTGKSAIVICNPVGYEFIRAFRSVKMLAERLARAGHTVVRFDYRTTGDSAGRETDDGRAAALLDSINEAIDYATAMSGTDRVGLVGLRLGATLAAKVAETRTVSQLVLWAPCDSGAIYVREQQIMAAAQKKRLQIAGEQPMAVDGVDAGGFWLSPATQADLSVLELGTDPLPGAPDVLLMNRDDIRVRPEFAQALEPRCNELTIAKCGGFKDMMRRPQLARVPVDTIDSIVNWFSVRAAPVASKPARRTPFGMDDGTIDAGGNVTEVPLRFGPDDRLFGILSTRADGSDDSRPALIFLCGGATHRVSANRMYVTMARRLAASGLSVLRVDIAGIGDSHPHEGDPAYKPYTSRLTDNVEAAMDAVYDVTGQQRFVLFGLCSGAYAAMHTALRSNRIAGLVLANQLVYYLSDDDLNGLNSGQVGAAQDFDFPRSSDILYRGAMKLLRWISPVVGWPGQWLSPWLLGGRLRNDLEALLGGGRKLAILLSSQDNALDALSLTCGKWLRQQHHMGRLQVKTFHGTDHTFSPTVSQHELSNWLSNYMATHK